MLASRWFRLSSPILATLLAASLWPANAAKKYGIKIGPGPIAMTAAEKAIQADPVQGIEHGVILIEETARNEDLAADLETAYHMRAKILSQKGRGLANVELPYVVGDGRLKEWWGRTILPDGTVHELDRDDLERQLLTSGAGGKTEAIRAALPGVVPGCVIDYGWVLRESGYYPYNRVPMQKSWPIKHIRYYWKPTNYFQGAYILNKNDSINLRAQVENQAIVIDGRDIPPIEDEPLMPPLHEVQAAAIFYYFPIGSDFEEYWDDIAKSSDGVTRAFAKKKAMKELLETIAPGAEQDLDAQLRAVYDWIGENFKRTGLMSFEELETSSDDDKQKRNTATNPIRS